MFCHFNLLSELVSDGGAPDILALITPNWLNSGPKPMKPKLPLSSDVKGPEPDPDLHLCGYELWALVCGATLRGFW